MEGFKTVRWLLKRKGLTFDLQMSSEFINTKITISPELFERVRIGMGQYFSKINNGDPKCLAEDMLNPKKSELSFNMLKRFVNPENKKILEIGSGYGVNVIFWSKKYSLDVIGLEPESEGFSDTLEVSQKLCDLNGLPNNKIVVGNAENIPFPDNFFDIVYSANVIEHTNDPKQSLKESIRILKPGGILHFEMPNFFSYFEGHYFVLMPPLFFKSLLPWWVKNIYRRDPAFAKTLHTEINPRWVKNTISEISKQYPVKVISLGEEIFIERLSRPFVFQQGSVGKVLGPLLEGVQKLNLGNILSKLIVILSGHYPIYLTIVKE